MTVWTIADIPPQKGRTAVITGATGGLGFETALALAGAGATVMLTGRNDDKGRKALARIRAQHPKADIGYETLDLASLASVADFAARFAGNRASLDLLINNAGVMALPTLFAASSPEAKGGGYYGPNGFYQLKGPPAQAKIMPHAKDRAVAAKLWDVSATLTGVSFDEVVVAA
jgi:NAD(P)-dependent dehydrogenase (short-subunit alcohol dehydrogenase family)